MASLDTRLPVDAQSSGSASDDQSYGSTPVYESKIQIAGGPAPMLPKVACELVGTFILAFTVGCCGTSGREGSQLYDPMAIACMLTVLVYSFGPVSGGHFNPAVSLAFGMCRKLPVAEVISYSLAQLTGAYLGCLVVSSIFDPVPLGPHVFYGYWQVGMVEAAFTCMLSFVALNVVGSIRNNPSQDENQFFALAIGFVFIAGGYAIGPISGCTLNPAIALALDATAGGLAYGLPWGIFYAICELGGGALASTVFIMCRPEELEADDEDLTRENYVPVLMTQLVSEMAGTFVVVLTAGLNAVVQSESAVWSTAAALMCMVYSLWDVSGAHFNPAVTLTVALSGRGVMGDYRWSLVGAYWSAQLSAAMLAALTIAHVHLQRHRFPTPHWEPANATVPATDVVHSSEAASMDGFSAIRPLGDHGWEAVFAGEMLFTALLGFTFLSALTVRHGPPSVSHQNFFFALAIAASLMAGGMAIGPVSGAKLSPAMVLAAWAEGTIFAGRDWDGPRLPHAAVYAIAELMGGGLAALLFFVLRPGEYRDKANTSGRNLNRAITVGEQLVHSADSEHRSSLGHSAESGLRPHSPHMPPTLSIGRAASSTVSTLPLSSSALPEALEEVLTVLPRTQGVLDGP